MDILAEIEAIADAIIDPFFVVDGNRTIIHFNRAFYSMLPRGVARGLKGKKIADVIAYELADEENCIVQRCWSAKRPIRLDEIPGRIQSTDKKLTFILSAKPFMVKDKPVGALVIQRNVTDEAQVQVKYQEMLDTAKREREQLLQTVRERTTKLLEANQQLIVAQRELLAFRRRRLV